MPSTSAHTKYLGFHETELEFFPPYPETPPTIPLINAPFIRSSSISKSSTNNSSSVNEEIKGRVLKHDTILDESDSSTEIDSVGITPFFNMVKRRNRPRSHSDSASNKKFWMPDHTSRECHSCQKIFTKVRRRHHCRMCGHIFCKDCCNNFVARKNGVNNQPERVCNSCYRVYRRPVLTENLPEVKSTFRVDSNMPEPSVMITYDNLTFESELQNSQEYYSKSLLHNDRATRDCCDGNGIEKNILDQCDLQELWRLMHDSLKFERVRVNLIRSIPECVSGTAIVNWLVNNDMVISRIQGVGIGQALVNADYMCLSSGPGTEFRDEDTWFYSPGKRKYELARAVSTKLRSSTLLDANLNGSLTQDPVWVRHIEDKEVEKANNIVHRNSFVISHFSDPNLVEKDIRRTSSFVIPYMLADFNAKDGNALSYEESSSAADSDLDRGLNWQNSHETTIEGDHKVNDLFRFYYRMHNAKLLLQLLDSEKLSRDWGETIFSLARRVSETVRPDVRGGDSMDIRTYIKIKAIPGGSKSECKIYSGVAFTGDVVNRQMRSRISVPQVLISRGGYECLGYRDESGDPQRLVCFDQLLMKEDEFFSITMQRILSLTPGINLLLLERDAASKAKQRLLENNISVVTNVKKSNLDRLKRALRCEMASSIECINPSLDVPIKLGSCGTFSIQELDLPNGMKKKLVILDGCPPALGCSIVLRGGNKEELLRVKFVLNQLIYSLYNKVLEMHFLSDSYAMPPNINDTVFKDFEELCMACNFIAPVSMTSLDCEESVRPSSKSLTASESNNSFQGINQEQRKSMFQKQNTYEEKRPNPLSDRLKYQPHRESVFCGLINSGVYSVSPFVDFHCPYLETNAGYSSPVRPFLREPYYWSARFPNEVGLQRITKLDVVNTREAEYDPEMQPFDPWKIFDHRYIKVGKEHPFLSKIYTHPSKNFMSDLADFRMFGRQICYKSMNRIETLHHRMLNKNMAEFTTKQRSLEEYLYESIHKNDCLDFFKHQTFYVLHSLHLPTREASCLEPEIKEMQFYGSKDFTLGNFIEHCFNGTCLRHNCGQPLAEHVRKFVCHRFSMHVSVVKKQDSNCGDDIRTWSYCHNCCDHVTPICKLSTLAWNYSFAKYLENKFFSTKIRRRFAKNSCNHSLLRGHHQYFSWRDLVCAIQLTAINVYEVSLPPHVICKAYLVFEERIFTTQIEKMVKLIDSLVEEVIYRISTVEMLLVNVSLNNPKLVAQSKLLSSIASNDKYEIKLDRQSLLDRIEENEDMKRSPEKTNRVHRNSLAFARHDFLFFLMKDLAEKCEKWNKRMETLHNEERICRNILSKEMHDYTTPHPEYTNERRISEHHILGHGMEGEDIGDIGKSLSSSMSHDPSEDMTYDSDMDPLNHSVTKGMNAGLNKMAINNSLDSTTGSSITCQDYDFCSEFTSNHSSIEETPLEIGSRVFVTVNNEKQYGILRWIGILPGDDEEENLVAGIETDEPNEIKGGNGTFGGRQVFVCKPMHGLFFSLEHVTKAESEVSSKVVHQEEEVQETSSTPTGKTKSDATLKETLRVVSKYAVSLLPKQYKPVQIPFSCSEHFLLKVANEQCPVLVSEDEPVSIIAYTLSSLEYKKKLGDLEICDPKTLVVRTETKSKTSEGGGSDVSLHLRNNTAYFHKQENSSEGDDSHKNPNIERMISTSKQHIEYQFSDSTTRFFCKVFFPLEFKMLRSLLIEGIDADEIEFVRSLSHSKPWKAKSGKSGSSFYITANNRYLIKELKQPELQHFIDFASDYFQYINNCLTNKIPTCLVKIIGVFKISYRNSKTGFVMSKDVLLMENIFYNRRLTQTFDLKGSQRNRLTTTSGKSAEDIVLMDENMLKIMKDSPIYLRPHSKKLLMDCIKRDTEFLCQNIRMDYSLLVGLEDQTKEIVVGIIDFVRKFTFDKKIEMAAKWAKNTVVGREAGTLSSMPTIVYPDRYSERFTMAMDRYFHPVPDQWYNQDIGQAWSMDKISDNSYQKPLVQ